MSLRKRLKRQLMDRPFRHAYADEHLNLSISTQIKTIREKQRMSQAALAEKIGTQQAGVSRIESANYNGWSIALLRRLAEAFDLRLRVSFEEFGTLWKEVDSFNRESLSRRCFEDDPEFHEAGALPRQVNPAPVSQMGVFASNATAADVKAWHAKDHNPVLTQIDISSGSTNALAFAARLSASTNFGASPASTTVFQPELQGTN